MFWSSVTFLLIIISIKRNFNQKHSRNLLLFYRITCVSSSLLLKDGSNWVEPTDGAVLITAVISTLRSNATHHAHSSPFSPFHQPLLLVIASLTRMNWASLDQSLWRVKLILKEPSAFWTKTRFGLKNQSKWSIAVVSVVADLNLSMLLLSNNWK